MSQAYEILVGHADGVMMRASVEDDLLVLGERFVNVDGEIVKSAERRHSAEFAIGEEVAELDFGGETHRFADGRGELVQFDVFGAGDNGEESFVEARTRARRCLRPARFRTRTPPVRICVRTRRPNRSVTALLCS